MPASPERSTVKLALSEDPAQPTEPASWIGPLVALGGMAYRYARNLCDRQLIVTVSVPRRDFAAVLVGCGWVVAHPGPQLDAPLEAFRQLEPQAPVRVVTETEVITDYFARLEERAEPRVRLARSQWMVSKTRAVAKLAVLEAQARGARPNVSSLGRWAGLDASWDARLASPSADLAIVGTRKWLQQDLHAFLATEEEAAERRPGVSPSEAGTIGDLLLPEGRNPATHFSYLYASSRLADQLPLPKEVRAAVLDGSGAIKYLAEIDSPVVICILDRSVADETPAEIVVQLRNTRGEPVSPREELGWRPPPGIEAVAFTVGL